MHIWGVTWYTSLLRRALLIFQTSDDDYLLSTIGLMVILHILFYGVGSIYIFMDVTNKPRFARKYKIQPGTNEPVDFTKLTNLFR